MKTKAGMQLGSYRFAAQKFAEAQAHFEKILPEYRCCQHFRDRVRQFRYHMAKGIPFFESREKLGLGDLERVEEWELVKYVVFSEMLNPEAFFQYLGRSRYRYNKAQKAMREAEIGKDRMGVLKALQVMSIQDEQEIEIKKQFGILNLTQDPSSGGEGYPSDDIEAANEQLRLLRAELRGYAKDIAGVSPPLPAHLLDHSPSGTEAHELGSVAVDAVVTRGSSAGHPNQESVANGGINGHDDLASVADKDKPRT